MHSGIEYKLVSELLPTTAKDCHSVACYASYHHVPRLTVEEFCSPLLQVDHELVMVGCDYYTPPGTKDVIPVYIVKNQWGTGPNGALPRPGMLDAERLGRRQHPAYSNTANRPLPTV